MEERGAKPDKLPLVASELPVVIPENYKHKSGGKRYDKNSYSDITVTLTNGSVPAGNVNIGSPPENHVTTIQIGHSGKVAPRKVPEDNLRQIPPSPKVTNFQKEQNFTVPNYKNLQNGKADEQFMTTVFLQKQNGNGWIGPNPRTEKYDTQLDMKERPTGDSWSVCSKPMLPSLAEDPSSCDDGQRSTSTLVRPGSSRMSTRDKEAQRGITAIICGSTVVLGAAIFLRLPGLINTFGAGSFLSAYGICLLLVAVPLGFLDAGLGQFSSSGVIGMWSLVPLARGVGWSAVVVCLYWGATAMGISAPWLHYIFANLNPEALHIPDNSCIINASNISADDYYRFCVYNSASATAGELDLRLTWPLPAGLFSILALASLSVTGGPVLLAAISGIGSTLAILGCVAQLVMAVCEILPQDDFTVLFNKIIALLVPNVRSFLQPEIWLAAMSQALLSLGPGIGLLLNHSSKNVFRFPLKRHLWFLTFLAIFFSALVSLTTLMQFVAISNKIQLPINATFSEEFGLIDSENFTVVLLEQNFSSVGRLSRYSFGESSSWISFSHDCQSGNSPSPEGAPFIIASMMISSSSMSSNLLLDASTILAFLGFFGAGLSTACCCLHLGVVAARESRSLPPAASAILLMLLLSVVAVSTVTKAGATIIHLLNFHVLLPGILWPPLISTVTLATFHGIQKIRKDLTFMLESPVSWVWIPIWVGFIPLVLSGLTMWGFVVAWYSLSLSWAPLWQSFLVWFLRASLLFPIPLTAMLVIKSQLAYGLKDKLVSSLQSSREWGEWGPQDPIEHHNWRRWREDETRSFASLERRLAADSRPLTYTHSTLSSVGSSTLTRLRAKYRSQTPASPL